MLQHCQVLGSKVYISDFIVFLTLLLFVSSYWQFHHRFKVRVRVMDNTSSASFVLFDREVHQLTGKSAPKLRSQLVEVNV